MRKIYTILLLSMLLTSCGVKRYSIIPNSETTYSPEINQSKTSEIGITLVSKETAKKYDAIEITKEVKIKTNVFKTLKIGEIFIKTFETEQFDLYANMDNPNFGIALSKNNKSTKTYSITPVGTGLQFQIPRYALEYKQTEKIPIKSYDYFKQEFIYNGRVGNGIKFIYREFVNDNVRPAFTQDLQYDLSDDSIIGIRGLRLEVVNATNTKIEYKILNHFE
jgi:hypothetical protein